MFILKKNNGYLNCWNHRKRINVEILKKIGGPRREGGCGFERGARQTHQQ